MPRVRLEPPLGPRAARPQTHRELTVPVTADPAWDKAAKRLQASWTTTDEGTDKFACPAMRVERQQTLTYWRGERVHAKLLVWSPEAEGELSFKVNEPEGKQWIDASTIGFLRYVMTDELNKDGKGGCGLRPDKTQYDSLLVADRIEPLPSLTHEARTVRPVWLTFQIPADAKPGTYKGTVEVKSTRGGAQTLAYTIRVTDRTLPATADRTFHLDLWQNPFAVARTAGTPLWSEAHFEAMRPLMQRLAQAGQRGITASITHKPWNGQTYDYFENMITEIRKADGTWMYDFTVFDRWVEFMQSCGAGPYIYCYSVIPWELTFRYYDQATNRMTDKKLAPQDPAFDEYWVSKLSAFARHLKEKGWFERTLIAMDERPQESMKAALRVIRKADPDFKISLAYVYHEELQAELFDYCIAYDHRFPEGIIEARRAQGKITTFYTCCSEAFPNTFTFSRPVEAATLPLVAAERNLDGYLRWAYNSWVQEPMTDTRFTAWAGGDTYLVYPGNRSSVRFEKLIEGIQIFEKIQVLKADEKKAKAIAKLLTPFAYENIRQTDLSAAIQKLNNYLNR